MRWWADLLYLLPSDNSSIWLLFSDGTRVSVNGREIRQRAANDSQPTRSCAEEPLPQKMHAIIFTIWRQRLSLISAEDRCARAWCRAATG